MIKKTQPAAITTVDRIISAKNPIEYSQQAKIDLLEIYQQLKKIALEALSSLRDKHLKEK